MENMNDMPETEQEYPEIPSFVMALLDSAKWVLPKPISKTSHQTYYYTYDDEVVGYITQNEATNTFYTKTEVLNMIASAKQELIDKYIVPLQERLELLENA